MATVTTATRPIKSHDVARDAGVSIGTVSKVLNNPGQLSEGARARVRAVAARLGFRPNDLAQSLHRKRSFTVGLISSDALDPARVALFVCKPTDDPEHERRHVEARLAKRVDDIIVTSHCTDPRPPIALPDAVVPVVHAYTQKTRGEAVCVFPDDVGGGRLTGQHLAHSGRRVVAHVT